jgi:hypothetical protein
MFPFEPVAEREMRNIGTGLHQYFPFPFRTAP